MKVGAENMVNAIYYELFIRKLVCIVLYKKENMSYEDIGYITNSSPQMIKLYDEQILSKKIGEEIIRKRGVKCE